MPSDPSWVYVALAALLMLLLIGLTAYLSVTEADAVEANGLGRRTTRRGRGHGEPAEATLPSGTRAKKRAAVIVNPIKFADVAEVRATVRRICATHGWADPLWLETTAASPGRAQAEAAVAAGVDVVCPLGGDGTVRNVASGLVDTGMPIGLLPGGTGNLLARNLGLPIESLRRSLTIALTGRDAPIDTCALTLTRPSAAQLHGRRADPHDGARNVDIGDAAEVPQPEHHVFLVMGGLGFDAEVMATAEEELKAQLGWGAYVLAGAQHLRGPQFGVDVTLADGHHEHRRVRSVIVGNVGKLQGGFELLPEARSDDGLVSVLLLFPQGLRGWAAVARRLVLKRDLGAARLQHLSSTRVRIEASKPVEVQIDGDTLGAAVTLDVRIRPGSLVVRLPVKSSWLSA